MSDWTIVLWNKAHQITTQLDVLESLQPDRETTPQAHFNFLRTSGYFSEAAMLIGAALPKIEMINWVCESLPDVGVQDKNRSKRNQLKAHIQRWIDDPDEEKRRTLFDIVETSNNEWPETLLALSIFYSGGSIAPENIDSIQPDPIICVQLAIAALTLAEASDIHANPEFLSAALDRADQIAKSGR